MVKKHQSFTTSDGDLILAQNTASHGVYMKIRKEIGYTYITKQEAMDFFGLMEKPEPKKPFYAELIKAHIMGDVIEYRNNLWQPSNRWDLLNDAGSHVAVVFLGQEEDQHYSFRIKPE